MLDRIKHRVALAYKLRRLQSASLDFNPVHNFYVFGDPRGGSTWLAEMLSKVPKTAILWEPLVPNYVEEIQDLGFSYRQYIPACSYWPEAKVAFDLINSGKVINEWTTIKSSANQFIDAERLLVKYCRGNALLPWFCQQYDFSFVPVYLIRHPFSVVCSQLKQGGWDYTYNGFHIPASPYKEIYTQHEPFLKTLTTIEEALVATWCITNLIPLRDKNKKWHEVYYEDLVLFPEKEIGKIFELWNLDIPASVLDKVRQPSSTAISLAGTVDPAEQLSKWKQQLSGEQINRMSKVMDYFELEYYDNSIYPCFSVNRPLQG